ncbi:Ldh family oxidoreductase [Pelomyxa schiedti]|nr:Ldh family oxidoreductase [Pelomyxa schiedti]
MATTTAATATPATATAATTTSHDDDPRMPLDVLERFMVDVLASVGVPREDAQVCGKVLIAADRKGMDTHGIQRLKLIYYDRIKAKQLNPITNFEIVRETPTTAVVDGHNGMGMVIANRCMQMAIDKAKKFGMGMVVARNSTHYGIAGFYSTMAAEQGCIGINGTNARPSVAPTWSVQPMLGTNPLVFAFPTDEGFPWCLDCATSVVQRGKIEMYEREGKPCPEGWVINQEGHFVTDTPQILKDLVTGDAACLPIGGSGEDTGGYKGYGFATIVEILSSCLQAGNFMLALTGVRDGKKIPIELGHFFIAVNIECFRPLDEFRKQVGDINRELRAARKAPGATRIWTCGEKEHYTTLDRTARGVAIPQGLRPEMEQLRRDLGLTSYVFPWDPKPATTPTTPSDSH